MSNIIKIYRNDIKNTLTTYNTLYMVSKVPPNTMASSVLSTDFHGSISTLGNLEGASSSASNKIDKTKYIVVSQNLPSVSKTKKDKTSHKRNAKENLKASCSTAEPGSSKFKSKKASHLSKQSNQNEKVSILIVNTKLQTSRFKNELEVEPSTTSTSRKTNHQSKVESDPKHVPLIERNSGNSSSSAIDSNFSSSIGEAVKTKKRGQGLESNLNLFSENTEMPRKRRKKSTHPHKHDEQISSPESKSDSTGSTPPHNHDEQISSPKSKSDSTDNQALDSLSNIHTLAVNQIKDNLMSGVQSAGSSPLYSTLDSTTFCEILLDKLSVDDLTLKEDTPCPAAEIDKNDFFDFIKKEDEILSISTLSEILPESTTCANSLNATVNTSSIFGFENDTAFLTEPDKSFEKIPKTDSQSVKKEEIHCEVFVSSTLDSNFDLDSIAMEVEVSTEDEDLINSDVIEVEKTKSSSSSIFCDIELPSYPLKENQLSEIPLNEQESYTCRNFKNDDIKAEYVNEHGYSMKQCPPEENNANEPHLVNKTSKIDAVYSKIKNKSSISVPNTVKSFSKTPSKQKVENRRAQREENEKVTEKKKRQNCNAMEERRVVYIGGLPKDCTVEQLHTMFTRYGPIEDVRVRWKEEINGDTLSSQFGVKPQNIISVKKKYFGFVTFKDKADADFAVFEAESRLPRYDVRFGGRRRFVGEKYTDLDERKVETESTSSKCNTKAYEDDYSIMLQREIFKRGLELRQRRELAMVSNHDVYCA